MNQRVAHINLDTNNTLVIPSPKRLCLRIPLPDYVNSPIKYELNHNGETYQGFLDKNGEVDIELKQSSGEADFKIWPFGEAAEAVEWKLSLGLLPNIDSLQGVQARLNNLGMNAGLVDGIMGRQTRAALKRFQRKHGLQASGELEPKTRKVLLKAHGS